MRAARAPALLLLFALTGCARSSEAPERPTFAARAPAACREAMQRVVTEAPGDGPSGAFITACSSTLFADSSCRSAWEKSTTQSPEVRLRTLLNGCAPATCGSTAAHVALCSPTPRWASSREVLAQWPEFQRAQLADHFGAEEARRIEPVLTAMLYAWSRTLPPQLSPKRFLKCMQRADEIELLLSDEHGQPLGRWTTADTWNLTQIEELSELLRGLPKANGPGETCVRLDSHPDVEFRKLTPVFQALQAANCGP
ncbi:MAG TPA: hypothetical protein VFO83_04890, partial [Aggregicoccus sp.]|nr:hypothetical protein [Aggregicoccus sp.]